MTKPQTYADHFDEIHALGIKKEEHLELFCRMKGGVWLTDNGGRTYIEPDPEGAGLQLLEALKVERTAAAAEAAGFDKSTLLAIKSGKISAKNLGLEVDLSVRLHSGVRSL